MSTLQLTLNKNWFEMIVAGVKKEEYREIKPYWIKRLRCTKKSYSKILFRNGYKPSDPTVLVEWNGLSTGLGIVEWGAPEGEEVFILKLGNVLAVTRGNTI